MTRRPDLPRQFSKAPFHVDDAADAGISSSRLRAADLESPFRGLRQVAGEPTAVLERCTAFNRLIGPDQMFSHATAGVLWGLWLPARMQVSSDIHVSAFRGVHAPRMRGVRGHHAHVGTIDRVLLGCLPVTSPLDTWRQLSTMLTLDELIAAGDSLVRRNRPLVEVSQLMVALGRHGGKRGARMLRDAWACVRARADSPRETRLRLLLIRAGLPEPLVNALVSAPGHGALYGDLVYPEWRVIVEYDGRHHEADLVQYGKDIARLERLAAENWIVIRVIAEHFADPDEIVRRVAGALRGRGWRP